MKRNIKCFKCGETMQSIYDEFSRCWVCESCNYLIAFCNDCDTELQSKIEGHCSGLYCNHCDEWKTVSTYIPPKE